MPNNKQESNAYSSFSCSTFQSELLRFVVLLTPMVKMIICVESDEISPEFVYLIWHAAIKAVADVLDDRRMAFPISVKEEILGVLSHRHSQFFGPGDLGSKVYLAAAYLNPSMLFIGTLAVCVVFTDSFKSPA